VQVQVQVQEIDIELVREKKEGGARREKVPSEKK